jgi:FG-GAP-like repeat/FG-GAP repeat
MRVLIFVAIVICSTALPLHAQPTWKKTVIDKVFRSEGVAIADVNKDGKMDILVGDFWYEAPDWKIHPIRRAKEFNDTTKEHGYYGDPQHNYSECMCCWTDDINGDGWPDQIVIGFPGKPAYWYENPKGQPGPWKEHVIWHSACNETPQYVDLFKNGKRVLVMGWQPIAKLGAAQDRAIAGATFDVITAENRGQMAWFAPGPDPTQLWNMHPISGPSYPGREVPGTQKFSHGLGVGDVNGDGRLDVICTAGWWEQPPEGASAGGPWKFHGANLGEACADMHVIDMHGGGKPSVVCSSAHKFGIWAYDPRPGADDSPTFLKRDLFANLVSETHAMHYVDLDGDGLKDLVTGKRFWSHGRSEPGSNDPARLYWLKAKKASDGMMSFTPHVIDDDSGIGTQFVVADFNGDGKLDIVTSNKKGVFLLLQQ